jgi:Ca-activated chloride channel homolog
MIFRKLALPAILMLWPVFNAPAQDATFSIAAEEVRIDVLVTEHGKPITGLGADDFEILDNGVPQEIQYVTLQRQTPISATLVFDLSMSVAGKWLDQLKKAASAFLSDLGKEDHAALILFNNAILLGSPPTRDFAGIKLALDRALPSGRSSLIDASYAGLLLAESRPDPPLLIIFSDGRDTLSWLTADAVLETAKHNDAVVYAVSTEKLPESSFLGNLTRVAGGAQVESAQDLTFAFLTILEEFRQSYLITYTPRSVTESGWHKLDVRVKRKSAKVRSRPGYLRNSRRP